MSSTPTPGLQQILDFVNTRDVEDGLEHLPDTQHLQSWLSQAGLLPEGSVLTDDDVRRAHEIREALRTVLLAHHGDQGADTAAAGEVLGSVALHLEVTDAGEVSLAAREPGLEGALGRLLAVIPRAAADGSWERAKICPNDTCQWAFYDQSRNRSRRWCSMEVCGNREKSRAFRTRHGTD
jgi:predicted RNA-binding Zn ribbon-like protein